MVAGSPPIRAKKARYYEERRLAERVLAPPKLIAAEPSKHDSWSSVPPQRMPAALLASIHNAEDAANGGLRREPELPDHVAIVKETDPRPREEFAVMDDEPKDNVRQARILLQQMRGLARQASLDPSDGLEL